MESKISQRSGSGHSKSKYANFKIDCIELKKQQANKHVTSNYKLNIGIHALKHGVESK